MKVSHTKNITFHIEKQTNQNIKYFVYNDKKYPINFDLLKNNCNYFYQNQKQYKDIDCINLINDQDDKDITLTENSIQAFISNCQNENCQIELSSVISLNYLACKYDYPALKKLTDDCIKENSNELIFQKLLFKLDESNTEKFISTHLYQYINDEQILQLPLPTIERIIQYHKNNPTIEKVNSIEIMNFLFRCLDRYGESASILFNDVDFREQNIGFLNRLLNDYSDTFNFNMINSTLAKTTTELTNELTNQRAKYSVMFTEMKERYDQQVDELTKMKNEAEEKLKKQEELNQLNIIEYKNEIKNIKDEMQSRIKSIENKFENILNQYESIINNGRLQKYNNVVLEMINYDGFVKLTDESKHHVINEISENQTDDKDNILFKKISCCQNLFEVLSKKTNGKKLYNSDRSSLIEFISEKLCKMNLKSIEVEHLFKQNSLAESLIDIMDNFESLFIEVDYKMEDIELIFEIINDFREENNEKSDKVILTLNIRKNDEYNKISKLKNIVNLVNIESTVNVINDESFLNFTKLTKIIINDSVLAIGKSSFKGCKSLKEISIPSSVKSIGSNAFDGCTSLTQILIPSSVASFGENIFNGIKKITLSNEMTTIPSNLFNGCTSLKEIIIPSTITSIGSNSFDGCTSLTQILIPSSVTSFGENIFNGIKKITLSNEMTTIPSNLFNGCTSLTKIIIPSSVKSIEPNAFDGCTSLAEIIIPSSVKSFGKNSFKGCNASIVQNYDYSQGHEMSGVFKYLTSLTKGNIHDNGTISITSTSNNNRNSKSVQPRNLCDFNDLSYNSEWNTGGNQNATLLFDFKQRKIKLTHYTLHTVNGGEGYPKSWIVECSNDQKKWIPRDNRKDEEVMNNDNVCHTFKCQIQSDKFYRYIRFKSLEDWDDDCYFEISAVEFFGSLK